MRRTLLLLTALSCGCSNWSVAYEAGTHLHTVKETQLREPATIGGSQPEKADGLMHTHELAFRINNPVFDSEASKSTLRIQLGLDLVKDLEMLSGDLQAQFRFPLFEPLGQLEIDANLKRYDVTLENGKYAWDTANLFTGMQLMLIDEDEMGLGVTPSVDILMLLVQAIAGWSPRPAAKVTGIFTASFGPLFVVGEAGGGLSNHFYQTSAYVPFVFAKAGLGLTF